MSEITSLPGYDELPVAEGAPPHSAWGLWGADDQLGALNLLGGKRLVEASRLVRKGAMFPLNWEMELPDPIIAGRARRQLPRHSYVVYGKTSIEDVLDNYYPQSSSQWDAFSHAGHPEYGFYNGATLGDVMSPDAPKCGIENWARRGIAGRAVLLDVGRWLEETGREFDYTTTTAITVDDLEKVRLHQSVDIRPGDVLLVRTGWMKFYLAQRRRWRFEIGGNPTIPGLESCRDMVRYLWNLHVAAIAADNMAVEALRMGEQRNPLEEDVSLHKDLMALCGVPLGEFWYLEGLADDCAQDHVYDCMLTSAPMNKRGGAGSPPNALAMK
jgi:kynurenine formamidase